MIAGFADLKRPAHKLSTKQSTALAATGKRGRGREREIEREGGGRGEKEGERYM